MESSMNCFRPLLFLCLSIAFGFGVRADNLNDDRNAEVGNGKNTVLIAAKEAGNDAKPNKVKPRRKQNAKDKPSRKPQPPKDPRLAQYAIYQKSAPDLDVSDQG